MLHSIPPEVLGLIVQNIRTQSDLKSLCEVSKRVSEVATPYLYQSITFYADDLLDLDDLSHKVKHLSSKSIEYTRRIRFKAPLNFNLKKRCPHYESDAHMNLFADTVDIKNDSEIDELFEKFGDSLLSLIRALKNDNLQSLSLDLGFCIPVQVLGDDADLCFEDQKCIQSLSLITDGGCLTFGHNMRLDLKPLTSLETLCWKGLIRGDHLDSLADFITAQEGEGAQRLRTLTLDLVDWSRAAEAWFQHRTGMEGADLNPRENLFAASVLGIELAQETILLTALETLRLTGISFTPFENELGHYFNMANLSRLQLRNCPSSLQLLAALLIKGISMKLKSFELAIDWECLHYYGDWESESQTLVIHQFLDSFESLEDLFLLLATPLEWHPILNSISNHHPNLKRLVLHERLSPGKIMDGFPPWYNSGELLFYDSKITCLGTSWWTDSLPDAQLCFEELPTKPRCKILHMRVSWVDYHKKHEEEVQDQDEPDSDSEDLSMLATSPRQKFHSYPVAATFNETSNTIQTSATESFSSSEGPTSQQPQISTRRRNIANRSNFNGPAKDLLEFARWVFGPDGIPELRVLAFGDFSHDGRWAESNVLLCRDQSLSETRRNFRPLLDSDFTYWDLIDENMDMLSACSPDHLLWADLHD